MVVVRATTAKRSHSSRPSVSDHHGQRAADQRHHRSATRINGIDSRVVMANSTTSSMRPPKKPPSTPSVMPIRPEVIDREDADQHGDARAVDQAREIVAAELIGAEQMHRPSRRPSRTAASGAFEVLRERIVRRDVRRDDRHQQHRADDQRAERSGDMAHRRQPARPRQRRWRSCRAQPRIEHRVHHVGQQRQADIDHGQHQHDRLHHREVVLADRSQAR